MRSMRGLRPRDKSNFDVVTQEKYLQAINSVTLLFKILMVSLSSVGLMVGGIGVVAIMMISVTERTREIGVRKALGATRQTILWQFLVEAATLTVVGGIVGMILGGTIAFPIRRDPIQVGFIDDEEYRRIQRRPIIAPEDVPLVERALPDAQAIALQSGWPTPMADVHWRDRTVGDAFVFGVTAPYVVVQDYQFAAGEPLTDTDVRERRFVGVLGFDVADKLFGSPAQAVGQTIRVRGTQFTVKGVIAKKGTVLGQSWDGFVMLPLTTFEMV